jgi:signal transduction histidine kinase
LCWNKNNCIFPQNRHGDSLAALGMNISCFLLGLSDILLEMPSYGPLNAKQSNALHNIRNSGKLLLQIINDLLDLSKIGAGKVDLKFGPIALQNICQLSLQGITNQAQTKNIKTRFSISPETITLMADEDRLNQILQKLLSNALKFTNEGGSLGIEVLGDPQINEVNITIWDTGIGIHPEDLPRLFQPFVQLDARLARLYNGAGICLVLVKHLVTLHAGRISVESVPDQGSRFTVSLPWKPQKNKPERPTPHEPGKKKNEWQF